MMQVNPTLQSALQIALQLCFRHGFNGPEDLSEVAI